MSGELHKGKIDLYGDYYCEFICEFIKKEYKPFIIKTIGYSEHIIPIFSQYGYMRAPEEEELDPYIGIVDSMYVYYYSNDTANPKFIRFSVSNMLGTVIFEFYPKNTNVNGKVSFEIAEDYYVSEDQDWTAKWKYQELALFMKQYLDGKVRNPIDKLKKGKL